MTENPLFLPPSENVNNSVDKKPETSNQIPAFALLMVKPHALKESADVTLSYLLGEYEDKPSEEFIKALNLPPDANEAIFKNGKLQICKTFYRNLAVESPNNGHLYDELTEIFYGRDKDKKHYSTLLDLYKGPVAFLVLKYDGPQTEMEQVLRTFKGREQFLGHESEKGFGVRGTFVLPKERIDIEAMENLPEEKYREQVVNVINNVIHITDNIQETARALEILLSSEDLDEMRARGIPIRQMIRDYTLKK